MNEHQRKEILAEQEKQRKEAENIKKLKEEEERLYALQQEVLELRILLINFSTKERC